MPCDSSYMYPSEREKESKEAAELICYIFQEQCIVPPRWAMEAAIDYYGKTSDPSAPDMIGFLCDHLRGMTLEQRDALVYGDPRNKVCRRLADWWERHEEYDSNKGRS